MRRIMVGMALLVSIMVPSIAAACGVLVPQDESVRQSQERIIFAVDRAANRITAYMQINYVGDADAFAWVLPVPNNPKVEISDVNFDELQRATEPRILFPAAPTDCVGETSSGAPGAVGAGAPEVLQQGSVGPFDFSVISDKDPAAITTWLRDNGYNVSDEVASSLKPYADGGMSFLAMKLQNGREASDIKPVAVTFEGNQPMIPLRLAAAAAEPVTPIYAWIFADQKALPSDSIYFVMRPNDFALTSMNGGNNYKELRTGVLDSVKGAGWVVEYALSTTQLGVNDPTLKELAAKYPYVTRLYTELSPEEMRNLPADPAFKFEPELQNIANTFDLTYRNVPYDCEDQQLTLHTVRRQQLDAKTGSRSTPEQATANLRRGPLQIATVAVIVAILGLIWFLSRGRRDIAS